MDDRNISVLSQGIILLPDHVSVTPPPHIVNRSGQTGSTPRLYTVKFGVCKNQSKRLKIFLVFITTIVVLTALEGISGVILEKLVHKVLWNYSDMKFNLGKYICLEVSFVWGIMSIVFLYVLKPFFDKVLKKIPVLFSNIMLIITITDILLSLIIRS